MMFFLYLVKDLKANESRLRDINKVASELESEGLMAEEAPIDQAQVSKSQVSFESRLPCLSCNLIVSSFFVFFLYSNKSCLVLLLARY